jgi:hypothetical protein
LVAEAVARAFVALTPFGVSAKIPASDAGPEIAPEPASTREGDKARPRRRRPIPPPTGAGIDKRRDEDVR